MQRYFAGVVSFALCVCLVSATAAAQDFSGYYDPANWTLITNADGSVNTASAPAQITLNGPDNGSNATEFIDFFIVAPAGGIFAFDWVIYQR